jgi:pyridoxine 4-dehydrogenase
VTQNSQFADRGRIAMFPRVQQEAIDHNIQLVSQIKPLAEKRGCTPAQFAVAWVRTMSKRNGLPAIVPIPGASAPERAQENSKGFELDEQEMEAVNKIVDSFEVRGSRYPSGAPVET